MRGSLLLLMGLLPAGPGQAVYSFTGETMGIRQQGREPLVLIISYPLAERVK